MNLRQLRREQTHLVSTDPGGHVRRVWSCCRCCATWKPASCPLAPHDRPCPDCTQET